MSCCYFQLHYAINFRSRWVDYIKFKIDNCAINSFSESFLFKYEIYILVISESFLFKCEIYILVTI